MPGKKSDAAEVHTKELHEIAWLLEDEIKGVSLSKPTTYGDVTELNTERTILDSVGRETLKMLAEDIMALLDTSVAVYEKNGDYAFGCFVSEWCSLMDNASRKLCDTGDNRKALDCGRWLCHENCWNDSARAAMESGAPTDIACVGGIRLYAVPIRANGEIIGVVNMGYGNPPNDEQTLRELSGTFDCEIGPMRKAAEAFKPRPPFIIDMAKKRLQSIATQIGKTVEAAQNAEKLKDLALFPDENQNPVLRVDSEMNLLYANPAAVKLILEPGSEVGKKIPAKWHPLVQTVWAHESPQTHDIRLGDKVYSFAATPIKKRGYINVYAHDVTAVKQVHEQVDEQRYFLAKAQEIGHIGTWELDLTKNRLIWTDENYRIFGLPIGMEMSYEAFIGCVHPDDREYVDKKWKAALEGKPYDIDHRLLLSDGTVKWVREKAELAFDEKGNCLKGTGFTQDITERRQMEESLREAKSLLQAALDQSDAGIAIADAPSGELRYVNDAGLLIRGGTRDSIVKGVGINEYVSSWCLLDLDGRPLEPDEVPLARAVMFGEASSREFIIRRSDEDDRIVLAKAAPIKDEEGKITAGIVVFMDITEHKQAEEELRTSRARLEALWNVSSLENADLKKISDHILLSIGRMTGSPFGFYGFMNDDESVMTIHSWTGDVMKHCSMDQKPTDFQIAESGIWAEAVRQRAPLIINNYESDHPAKKGLPMGHVPLRRLLVVPNLTNGRITSVVAVANGPTPYDENDVNQLTSFLGGIQAITDAKQAQEALLRRERQLSQALEMGKMGHWELDVANGIFTFSDNFYAIFHTTANEVGGYQMSAEDYAARFVHPEDSYRVAEETRKAIETDDPHFNQYLEHRMLYADGTMGYIAVRFFVTKNSDGKTIRTYGVNQDITELKRMQEELQKTQRLESLGLLAGGIAHDFNNLLGGIFGNIDLAQEQIGEASPGSRYLERGLKAIDRAKDLTQQLLTFSKGGAPRKTVVQLASIIEESCALALSGSNIAYDSHVDKDFSPVEADPNQISQVLNNVLLNARQAMPDGGSITIRASNHSVADKEVPGLRAGDYAKIAVADNGCGIPDALIQKVFDPFFTTKDTGSGLGLATCHSIIRQHEGTISIESQMGQGTTVSIYLPTSDRAAEQKSKAELKSLRMSGRILVMDDEEVMREVAEGMLQLMGFEVICTRSGKEAIEVFEREKKADKPFDVVLLDLTEPGGIGGEQTMSEMLRIDPAILGVVSSGYADSPVLSHPESYGFSGKIEKPYRRAALSKVMEEALKKKSD